MAFAQGKRMQLPGILSDAYFGVELGHLHYHFTNELMAPGYDANTIKIPGAALKITLFGYRFNPYVSASITYMRPFNWVEYNNINNSIYSRTTWMNFGGLTFRGRLPLSKKLSVEGEAGMALVTRRGFLFSGMRAMDDAQFVTVMLGYGLSYALSKKFDVVAEGVFIPSDKASGQSHTHFIGGGLRYNLQKVPDEKVKEGTEYYFAGNHLQVGFASNSTGYGVNNFFSEGMVPVFWGGVIQVKKGFTVTYERNIFHTKKVFALDVGVSAGYYTSRENAENFFTVSVYPMLKFTFLRTRPLDIYFKYSVAGPTYISRTMIDSLDSGKRFTFQDLMGVGIYAGKKRHFSAALQIGHYSNGNIFPQNQGIKIPLTLQVGYAF